MPLFTRVTMPKDLLNTLDPDIIGVYAVREYGELSIKMMETDEIILNEQALLTLLEFLRRNK